MMNLCVFVGPEKERKVPRSGFRRLGKHHMTADVFSLAIGPASYHSFGAGWVHCRLCHVDVEINLRGQSAWKAHWRSKEHYALEFQYRITNFLPVYSANYQLTNPGRGKKVDLVDPASLPEMSCVALAVKFIWNLLIVCPFLSMRLANVLNLLYPLRFL